MEWILLSLRSIPRRVLNRLGRSKWDRLVDRLPADWDGPGHQSGAAAIFVGGCQRSGTTLLREILGRHSNLAAGPETGFFWDRLRIEKMALHWGMEPGTIAEMALSSRSLTGFADAFFRPILERANKSRFVDKTCGNVRAISKILNLYPRARFLHIVRDGRDACCSLKTFASWTVVRGRLVAPTAEHPHRGCAEWWVSETSHGLAYRDHPRCLEVRYENLVRAPAAEVERICAFIGEAPEPGMLVADPGAVDTAEPGRFLCNRNAPGPIATSGVGRWQRDLSPQERAIVHHVAGGLMMALGHVRDASWVGV